MQFFKYTIEANLRSKQPFTHIKLHNYRQVKHLVWWKLSLRWGKTQVCEFCDLKTGLEEMCQDCYEYYYCECGRLLDDAWGTPGDGLCVGCR